MTGDERLRLEVLTPESTVFNDAVDAVVVPLADGWLGVLPGHFPFCARLMPGQIVFRGGGQERKLATIGGTLVVSRDRVTVLTGAAVLDRDFDALEQDLRERITQVAAVAREAERHFERVYRQMARTLQPRARGRA